MSKNVVYPWAEVFINGKSAGVHPVEISAEISGDLPGRLNFGSGIAQRTGVIRWDRVVGKGGILLSPARRVADGNFRLPSPRDRVIIRMGKQDTDPLVAGLQDPVTVFTGKVDFSEVPHNGYPITHIVDDIDRLNRVTRFYPYRHRMPPLAGLTNYFRNANFTTDTLLTWIAERCGFYAHPRHPAGSTPYVTANLQGSGYPTPGFGTLVYAHLAEGDTEEIVRFVRTKTGLAIMQGILQFSPANNEAREKLVVSFQVGAEHASTMRMRISLAGSSDFVISVSGQRRLTIEIGGLSYPAQVIPEDGRVCITYDTSGTFVVTTEQESVTISTATRVAAAVSWVVMSCLTGPTAISGLCIYGTDGSDMRAHGIGFEPTALIDGGRNFALFISRSIRDRKAIDVIQEICEATLCVCYLDGLGRLVIKHGRSAYGDPTKVMGTLGVKKEIKAYQVKEDSQLAAASVVIKYDTEILSEFSNSAGSFTTLWEAPSTQIAAGETKKFAVGPGADEEWLEVDMTMSAAKFNLPDFRRKDGSFGGFAFKKGTPGNTKETWGTGKFSFERVTPWFYQVTCTPDEDASTQIPEVEEVPASMWGKGLPVVRGGALIKITEADPVIVGGGPEEAADLIHECGTWMTENRAKDIATFISRYAFSPLPVIENVSCFFDPRIDVNTKWKLDLLDSAGLEVTVFILGVTHDPANDETRIKCRVLTQADQWIWASLVENYETFGDVAEAYPTFQALTDGEKL